MFEKTLDTNNDTGFDSFISYNDILDSVERRHNNEDGHLWKFREILSHSFISEKKEGMTRSKSKSSIGDRSHIY